MFTLSLKALLYTTDFVNVYNFFLFYKLGSFFSTDVRQPQINSWQKNYKFFYLIVSFSSFKILSIRTSLSALTPSLSAVDARSSADRRRRFRWSPLSSLPSNMAPSWWLAVVGVPKKIKYDLRLTSICNQQDITD